MLSFIDFLIESARTEFHAKQAKLPVDTVDRLADADPNPKQKNLGWIVRQYKNNKLRADMFDKVHPDDIAKHRNALQKFEDDKRELGPLDRFKHVDHLRRALAIQSNIARTKNLERKYGEKVFDQDNHQIWKINEPEHATNHGKTTSWCTRILDGTHQQNYMNAGTLYVHYPAGTPKPGSKEYGTGDKAQFFVPHDAGGYSPEIRDQDDDEINPYNHEQEHPILKKSEHWNDFHSAHQDHHNGYDNEDGEAEVYNLANSTDHHDRVDAVTIHGAHSEFDHLWDDPHHEVKKAIIDVSGLRAHRYYKDDDDEEVRGHVAYTASNSDVLKHMEDNHWDDHEVREGLAKNSAVSLETKLKLVEPHEEDTEHDTNIIHRALAKTPHGEVHHQLADYYKDNKDLDYNLSKHNYYNMANYAAERNDTEFADKLMASKSYRAKNALAVHFGNDDKYFHKLKAITDSETGQREDHDNIKDIHFSLGRHRPHEYTEPNSHPHGMWGAAEFGDEKVHDALIANHPNLDTHSQIYNNIAQAIVENGKARHMQHFMNSSTYDVRNALSRRVRNHFFNKRYDNGGDPEVESIIPHLAKSNNPEVRAAIAHKTDDKSLHDQLKDDPDSNVKLAAKRNDLYGA